MESGWLKQTHRQGCCCYLVQAFTGLMPVLFTGGSRIGCQRGACARSVLKSGRPSQQRCAPTRALYYFLPGC